MFGIDDVVLELLHGDVPDDRLLASRNEQGLAKDNDVPRTAAAVNGIKNAEPQYRRLRSGAVAQYE